MNLFNWALLSTNLAAGSLVGLSLLISLKSNPVIIKSNDSDNKFTKFSLSKAGRLPMLDIDYFFNHIPEDVEFIQQYKCLGNKSLLGMESIDLFTIENEKLDTLKYTTINVSYNNRLWNETKILKLM